MAAFEKENMELQEQLDSKLEQLRNAVRSSRQCPHPLGIFSFLPHRDDCDIDDGIVPTEGFGLLFEWFSGSATSSSGH